MAAPHPKTPHPRKLLVEGADDLRVIPELIEAATGVRWGESRDPKLVEIAFEGEGGIDQLLKPGLLGAELKVAGRQALGVIVDADEDPESCWRRLRERCLSLCSELPATLPTEGLVCETNLGVRLGIWVMPDNKGPGMLETFLATLRIAESDGVWQHAQAACKTAAELGAPFKSAHRDKALIHTWLSWQDPPGAQLHQAVRIGSLDPKSPQAAVFVAWFRRLFAV
ncbi:MAG TPA: hypothetical protein PLW65_16960 [Pseudomonadota bacterium]|nr:hypothetical protein [Pseudomonadota bacterium]